MATANSIKVTIEDESDDSAGEAVKKPKKARTAAKPSVKRVAVKKAAAGKDASAPKKAAPKKAVTTIAVTEEEAAPKKKSPEAAAVLKEIDERVLDLNAPVKKAVDAKPAEPRPAAVKPLAAAPASADPVRSAIARSIKEEEAKTIESLVSANIRPPRSVRTYRKIAYFFVLLTVILVAAVAYFMYASVTIVLIPNQERIANTMIFDVVDTSLGETGPTVVPGAVREITIKDEWKYTPTGKEVIGKAATGKATIINSYTKAQPLVATTRLLAPDGTLFRLKNTVNVPAGGQAEVEIYADDPSPDLVLAPTRLVIPGLWAGIQDKVYAETAEPIEYKEQAKLFVTDEDIDNSIRDLKQRLLQKAKDEISETYKEYGQVIYKIDDTSIESDVAAKAGDETESFTATMAAEVIVVAFADETAAALARQKFVSALPETKELVFFDDAGIIYALNNFDQAGGRATVNSTFEGKVSLKKDSNVVDVDKIVGLSKTQLDAYLTSLPEIAGFEVRYFPSFIKRVPHLVDRITVEIKK